MLTSPLSRLKEIFAKVDVNLFYISFYSIVISVIGLSDDSTQSLIAHDEGLYARRAGLIVDQNNWFTPFDNPHHKTVGSYWLIALSIKFLGATEFSVRLPGLVFSCLSVLLTYLISSYLFDKRSSLLACLAMISMPLWYQYSRTSSPDTTFIFFILLIIYCLLVTSDSSHFSLRSNFFYILAGLSLSLAFFLRSFMLFIPLIGLGPFIYNQLSKAKLSARIYFFLGIFVGSIPLILSLYYSYNFYGWRAISSIFNFATQQAVDGHSMQGLLYYPQTLILLTLPYGIISVVSFCSISQYISFDHKRLLLFYPLTTFTTLLLISTSYSHYLLILLPSLTLLLSATISSYRTLPVSKVITIRRIISIVYISASILLLLVLIALFFDFISIKSFNSQIILPVIIFLLSSYLISSLLILERSNKSSLLLGISIPWFAQTTSLVLLFSQGVLGNSNHSIKSFIRSPSNKEILLQENIGLLGLDSKHNTLLRFYLKRTFIVETDNLSSIKRGYYLVEENLYLNSNLFKRSNSIIVNKVDSYFLIKYNPL